MSGVDFSQTQGHILKGFNKPTLRLIFFRFGDDMSAIKKWLMTVSRAVPSTSELIKASKDLQTRRSEDPNYRPQDVWIHVSLSKSGVEKLGLQVPPSTGIYNRNDKEIAIEQGHKVTRDPFFEGMRYREDILRFSFERGLENWVEPFKSAVNYKVRKNGTEIDPVTDKKVEMGTEIDALFIVASDNEDDGDSYTLRLIEAATVVGSICLGLQIGRALENEQGKQVEHFGFRDGVSQPLVEGIDDEDIQTREIDRDKLRPEDFVLFGLTGGLEWANNGSFLAFRRLRQDVGGFWKFMRDNCVALSLTPEELAAKIVGRWKSGAPLAKHAHDPVDPEFSDYSDFSYSNDLCGCVTPSFAHIRITNPKDTNLRDAVPGTTHPMEALKENIQHRILRRAIPYGLPWAQNREQDADRGLLFMCFQRDLIEQFEHVQTSLYNSSNYPEPAPGATGLHNDIIRVLLKQEFKPGLEQWVTPTGGEYFFSPSIFALENLLFPRFPPDSKPYGLSLKEYIKKWWLWFLTTPKTTSPALDNTGKDCAQNQNDSNVWFLAGTLGETETVQRECNIPDDRAILVPIINDEQSFAEKQAFNIDSQLEDLVRTEIDGVREMRVIIDGVRLPDFEKYRIKTEAFDVTLPEDNIWGVKPGPTRAAADGYWLFLRPLAAGKHTLYILGRSEHFATEVTYNLVVGKQM